MTSCEFEGKPATEPASVPIFGASPVGDPILDAAARCVQRSGFDNVSLEEVATDAGVSRTTLYRRFGNRESLFAALLWVRSEPFRKWSRTIFGGHGSVAERTETVLVRAVMEMQQVGWLDVALKPVISPLAKRLLKNTYAQGAGEGVGPLVDALLAEQPEFAEIGTSEVLEWLIEQMIAFAGADWWEEEALRLRVRFFVIPVVTSRQAGRTVDARLDAIESKIDRLLSDG